MSIGHGELDGAEVVTVGFGVGDGGDGGDRWGWDGGWRCRGLRR